MLMAGAAYTPPVNYAPSDTSDNPYIMVDTDSIEKNYIKYIGHSTIGSPPSELVVPDGQFANTQAMMDAKYPEYKTTYLFKDQKSILGFDAPSMSDITRLTIKIRFKTFAKVDFLNFFPKYLEETFVIQSANRFQPYSYYALHNDISGADTKEDFVSNYTLPYIGKISDIVSLQNSLNESTKLTDPLNVKDTVADFQYVIDNPAFGNNYYSISSSNLADKDFYVIMPCFFDINRVWISIAGEDTDGNPVEDGLDVSGVPKTYDIDEVTYKYIDLDPFTARSVYFSSTSTIVSIVAIGDDVGGQVEQPYLRFGDFDFHADVFRVMLEEFWITDTGEYINYVSDRFVVLPGYDAVVSEVMSGDVTIRVSYDSDGFAVYQNIVGTDGIENPSEDTEAPGDSVSWWDDYFFNPLTDALATFGLVLRIVLLVTGLGLVAWAVILITRSLNKSKKGGK
jgi:hypothetical protein